MKTSHWNAFKSAWFIVNFRAPRQFTIKLDCFKGCGTFAPTVNSLRWTELRTPNVSHFGMQTLSPKLIHWQKYGNEISYKPSAIKTTILRKIFYRTDFWHALFLEKILCLNIFSLCKFSLSFCQGDQGRKKLLVNTHTEFRVTWRRNAFNPMSP